MSKYAFAELRDDRLVSLCVVDGSVSAEYSGDVDAVYVAASDYDTRRMGLPEGFSERDLRGYAALRVAALFPVSEGSTFDAVIGAEGFSANVLLIRDETLAAYRRVYAKAPLFAGAARLGSAPMDGDRIVITRDWIERFALHAGAIVETRRIQRMDSIRDSLASALDIQNHPEDRKLQVLCAEPSEARAVAETLGDLGFREVIVAPLETIAPEGRRARGLFVPERKSLRIDGALPYIAIAVMALVVNAGIVGVRSAYTARFARAETFYKKATATLKELGDIKKRITDVQKQEQSEKAKRLPSPYEVMSILASVTGGSVMLDRITMDGRKFDADCVASDSLQVLRLLEHSSRFAQTSVRNIVPLANGSESFTLTGTFNDGK